MHFRCLNRGAAWRDQPVEAFPPRQPADGSGLFATGTNERNAGQVNPNRIDVEIGIQRQEASRIDLDARAEKILRRAGNNHADIDELFARCDVISLHCPLTAQTAGLVNRLRLTRMKPSAFLINTARGALVVEPELAEALNQGRLAGAALDVVSQEPIRADNPLLGARNCLITPHIAWATEEARARLMEATVANVAGFLAGQPINVVNHAPV